MDLKDEKIVILSVFIVLIASWFIGNLMDMRGVEDSEPVLARPPGSLFAAGILILIAVPFLYFLYIYFRSESDKGVTLSGFLLLGFWIFAFLGGVIFVVFAVFPLGMQTKIRLPFDPGFSSAPLLLDLGFILLLLPIGFLLSSYLYLHIRGLSKKEEYGGEDVLKREELLGEEAGGKEKKIEDSLSSTLDETITDLQRGGEIRSAIIKCYQEMSQVLEERGAKNDDSMTPREFKEHAVEEIPSVEKMISNITFLFEEARYSPHELDERARDKVLKQLEELKEGLK